MNLTRKSIISSGCAIVLACGLIILLVLLTSPLVAFFSSQVQKVILISIIILSFLIAMPLIFRKLNRFPDVKKVLGWTFLGLGTEFILFPFTLLIYILNLSSVIGIIIGVSILTVSFIFAIPAGLISIVIGISLVKRR